MGVARFQNCQGSGDFIEAFLD